MRFKEEVGLLDGRDFVCCFCISSKCVSSIEGDCCVEERGGGIAWLWDWH